MPNHVKNVLKFKNLKSEDINFILNTIAKIKSPIDDFKPIIEYEIDFDKIIPEPKTEDECPKKYKVKSAKEAHISEDVEKPWFNWYDWHCSYWGTKWNAYDCYTKIGKSYITFVFNTAWNEPDPIIKTLALLGYDIEYKFADEDIGSNCGIASYKREQGWITQFEDELPDPEKFAKNIWKNY